MTENLRNECADAFDRYSAYYDLLYRDKDYRAEAVYVGRTLRTVSPHLRSVLELGSGTGKHGRLLAAEGFQVFGVERSETMVYAAKQASGQSAMAGNFDCAVGDARDIALGRKFEAVIALFHVISYQTTNEDVLRTFAAACNHLNLGGYFFFDVWHGPAVLFERPVVRVKRVENEDLRLTRIAEPLLDTNNSTVTVNYTLLAEAKENNSAVTVCEAHRMRYFFPVEIALIAAQAGFAIVQSEEFLSGHCPSERTWSVAYLLQKRH